MLVNPERNSNIQYGWKCPCCGAVMAPWQSNCINCTTHSNTITCKDLNTWTFTLNNATVKQDTLKQMGISNSTSTNTLDQIKTTLKTNLTK